MQLNYTIEDELILLNKYKISPTELFTLKLILLSKDDEEFGGFIEFAQIMQDTGRSVRDVLVSLQDKGLILKGFDVHKKGLAICEIPVNKNVTKTFYKASFEMGKELFEHYPQFGYINGRAIALRGVSKKFNSLEDAYRIYGKAISNNPDIHKEIIETLEWCKNNFEINFTLATFIVDHKWEDLKAIKEGKVDNVFFDSFTDI